MKKIFVWIILLLILTSCWVKKQDNIENKNNLNNNKIKLINKKEKNNTDNKKIISDFSSGIIDKINQKEKNNDNNFLEKKELKKIDEFRNSNNNFNFWFKDCNSLFKTKNAKFECQKLSLKEISVWCTDTFWDNAPWNFKIEKLFNLNKFNLLDKNKVLKLKWECIKNRKKSKNIDTSNNNLSKEQIFLNNFKLSDCEKYSSKLEEIYNDSENPVDDCKISFAINIANDCNILNWKVKDKCLNIKKDIDLFRRLKINEKLYWNFNLYEKIIN